MLALLCSLSAKSTSSNAALAPFSHIQIPDQGVQIHLALVKAT